MRSFEKMPLAKVLKKSLTKMKFMEATEVQSAVIPVALQGRDFMTCAQTGSGKTGAYGIPMVTRLLQNSKEHALVLAPTRELVFQITTFLRDLTTYCDRIQVAAVVGGVDIRKQMRALKQRPRIVVATPGRLIDHLQRGTYSPSHTHVVVLDEGDRMLEMGFAPQLNDILGRLPTERQTSLFTATLPDKVLKLSEKYLKSPEVLKVGPSSLPVAAIKQGIKEVTSKKKDETLIDELHRRSGSVIVFSRTKNRTDLLAKTLGQVGFSVGLIHGGRSQDQRSKAIDKFKTGKVRILCATDVAARGIDVPEVEHVINYDLPVQAEDYVHRIGRTARNGAKGEALSFVTPEEHRMWTELVSLYKITGANLVGKAANFQETRASLSGGRKARRSRPSSRNAEFRPKRSRSEKPRSNSNPRNKKRRQLVSLGMK